MIHNHNPKPLTEGELAYLIRNPASVAKNRPVTMDEPSRTLPAVLYKGVPYGLFYKSEVSNIHMPTLPLLDSLPKLAPNGLSAVSLFSGGGLLDLGFVHAGYNIVYAIDFDKGACRAYSHNFGANSIVCGDITKVDIDDIPDSDIIIGGPPCQDYSVAGRGEGEEGERGKLVWSYLNIIQHKQPRAFLFENVKGLIGKKHRHTFDTLLSKFDEIGYNVSWKLLNAWDYGVAQKRERVIVVGIRKDLDVSYTFPPSEYETTGYHPVLRDAIGDLPEPSQYYYNHPHNYGRRGVYGADEPSPAIRDVNRPMSSTYTPHPNDAHVNAHIQTQSTTVKPTDSLSSQRSFVANWDSPARTVNTNRLDHAEIHLGSLDHVNMPLPHGTYEHAKNKNIGYCSSLDEPSSTVRAKPEHVLDVVNHHGSLFNNVGNNPTWEHANREANLDTPAPARTEKDRCDGINPINGYPRRFSVREVLRIQSVPDSYVFPNDMSLSAMYRVTGNAVPSRMAYHLAAQLSRTLLRI